MRAHVVAVLSLVLFLACSGTSTGPGGGPTPTGGGCGAAASCAGGLCATSQDFPGGYCTQGCSVSNPASCPSGSVCVDDASGLPMDAGISAICYQTCATNADCTRAGYACLEKANHLVCRNGK